MSRPGSAIGLDASAPRRVPSERALAAARTGLVVLVFIDLLFMPRLTFAFGIPSALLLIALHIAANGFDGERLVAWCVMLVAVFASVAYGTLTGINPEPVESLKRAAQLMSILLFAFPRIDVAGARTPLVRCLRLFYVYVALAALLFYLSPEGYDELVRRVYPEAADALADNLGLYRFPYFFEDPNSAGYFIALTLAVYVWLEPSRRWKIVSSALAIAAVAATQSRGAYVAVLVVYAAPLLRALRTRDGAIAVLVGVAALFVVADHYAEELATATTVFEARLEMEDDVGGGRVDKYGYFLSHPNPLPFGTGYHLQRDGELFRPHSDLLRVELGYGLVALFTLLWFVAPRRRAQLPLFVVFLIPFLINTIIDDYRLFPFYLLALGMMRPAQRPAAAVGRGGGPTT